MTQTQLGKELGVSSNYVGMIESGRMVDPDTSLYKLFTILESRAQQQDSETPRSSLKSAREKAGLSQRQLAKKIGRDIGYVQAMEDGSARISEGTAQRVAEELPSLSKDELMSGSDHPRIIGGVRGAVGTKPDIDCAPDLIARYVPLISWAQAGEITDFEDIYEFEGQLAFNVQDPRAIAVPIRGDSMEPSFRAGDVAILYPSRRPQTGNLVIAKLKDEGVIFKRFQVVSNTPPLFRFVSENTMYATIERTEEEIAWIYPVANVVKNLL